MATRKGQTSVQTTSYIAWDDFSSPEIFETKDELIERIECGDLEIEHVQVYELGRQVSVQAARVELV